MKKALLVMFSVSVLISSFAAAEQDLDWDAPDRPDVEGRTLKCEDNPELCRELQTANRRYRDHARKVLAHASPTMQRIARNARRFAHAARNFCYRAVKRILYNTDPSTRGKLNGGSAIDAMRDLPRAGYSNGFPHACRTPGAILVYKGPAHKMSRSQARQFMRNRYGLRATAGDIHGHIEVLGSDGMFHHFNSTRLPINHPKRFGPWRRQLVGCFVK